MYLQRFKLKLPENKKKNVKKPHEVIFLSKILVSTILPDPVMKPGFQNWVSLRYSVLSFGLRMNEECYSYRVIENNLDDDKVMNWN